METFILPQYTLDIERIYRETPVELRVPIADDAVQIREFKPLPKTMLVVNKDSEHQTSVSRVDRLPLFFEVLEAGPRQSNGDAGADIRVPVFMDPIDELVFSPRRVPNGSILWVINVPEKRIASRRHVDVVAEKIGQFAFSKQIRMMRQER